MSTLTYANTITVTTAIGEGGSSTNIMRHLFSKIPDTTLIFDRKPGADGLVAANYYKNSGGNNSFILAGLASTFIISDILYKPIKKYNREDFKPVISLGRAVSMVVASNNSNSSTMEDIKKRSLDGEHLFVGHMSGIVRAWASELSDNLDNNVTLIPYKSAGQLGNDVAAGHVEFAILNGSTATNLQRNGLIKIIAIINNDRLSSLPDVPTVAETFNNFGSSIDSTIALLMPSNTNQKTIEHWNSVFKQIMKTPEAQEVWAKNEIYFNESDLEIPLINKRLDNMIKNRSRIEKVFK